MIIKPAFEELVQVRPAKRTAAVFAAAMKNAQKEQKRVLKQAEKLEK